MPEFSPDQPILETIAIQLQSAMVKDRVLAMIELQKDTIPAAIALPFIKQALSDRNVQVRGMAAFSLGIQPTPENLALLIPILAADPDHNMRAIAAGALGYLADQRALESLRHAFYEDTHWLVQFSAAVALGNLQDPKAQAVLQEALYSSNELVQEAAIMALGELGAVDTLDDLLPFAQSQDWLVRKHLADALGNLPDERSQNTLQNLANDPSPQVSEAAHYALERLAKLL